MSLFKKKKHEDMTILSINCFPLTLEIVSVQGDNELNLCMSSLSINITI